MMMKKRGSTVVAAPIAVMPAPTTPSGGIDATITALRIASVETTSSQAKRCASDIRQSAFVTTATSEIAQARCQRLQSAAEKRQRVRFSRKATSVSAKPCSQFGDKKREGSAGAYAKPCTATATAGATRRGALLELEGVTELDADPDTVLVGVGRDRGSRRRQGAALRALMEELVGGDERNARLQSVGGLDREREALDVDAVIGRHRRVVAWAPLHDQPRQQRGQLHGRAARLVVGGAAEAAGGAHPARVIQADVAPPVALAQRRDDGRRDPRDAAGLDRGPRRERAGDRLRDPKQHAQARPVRGG